MTIAFVHSNKAFLPALHAYMDFFEAHGVKCEKVLPAELDIIKSQVEWCFMGTDLSKPREGILKIHEYTSTSAPPFRKTERLSEKFYQQSNPTCGSFKTSL